MIYLSTCPLMCHPDSQGPTKQLYIQFSGPNGVFVELVRGWEADLCLYTQLLRNKAY